MAPLLCTRVPFGYHQPFAIATGSAQLIIKQKRSKRRKYYTYILPLVEALLSSPMIQLEETARKIAFYTRMILSVLRQLLTFAEICSFNCGYRFSPSTLVPLLSVMSSLWPTYPDPASAPAGTFHKFYSWIPITSEVVNITSFPIGFAECFARSPLP